MTRNGLELDKSSRPRRGRRGGFTLIELLVVIAVIAILIAMFFIGYRHVSRNAKENQTKATLEAAANLLAEYESTGGALDRLNVVYFAATGTTGRVDAPGLVAEGTTERDGPAVQGTRAVMKLLMAVPNNRKIVEGLKSDLLWRKDLNKPDEVVLIDAYGNPILFIPAVGLKNVSTGKNKDGTFAQADANVQASTANRPFFTSAGEDGIFKNGDDNQYSTAISVLPK